MNFDNSYRKDVEGDNKNESILCIEVETQCQIHDLISKRKVVVVGTLALIGEAQALKIIQVEHYIVDALDQENEVRHGEASILKSRIYQKEPHYNNK